MHEEPLCGSQSSSRARLRCGSRSTLGASGTPRATFWRGWGAYKVMGCRRDVRARTGSHTHSPQPCACAIHVRFARGSGRDGVILLERQPLSYASAASPLDSPDSAQQRSVALPLCSCYCLRNAAYRAPTACPLRRPSRVPFTPPCLLAPPLSIAIVWPTSATDPQTASYRSHAAGRRLDDAQASHNDARYRALARTSVGTPRARTPRTRSGDGASKCASGVLSVGDSTRMTRPRSEDVYAPPFTCVAVLPDCACGVVMGGSLGGRYIGIGGLWRP